MSTDDKEPQGPALPAELEAALAFDARGLVPAIAQRHDSGENLMMTWMNRAAIAETLATGQVCYWSRSRGALWRKGERSGQSTSNPTVAVPQCLVLYSPTRVSLRI